MGAWEKRTMGVFRFFKLIYKMSFLTRINSITWTSLVESKNKEKRFYWF